MMDLILGYGEVGKALGEVLGERREILIHDPKTGHIVQPVEGEEEIDWMHVCFPHSQSFKGDVCAYRSEFRPKHVVIHSTVPVGTTLQVLKQFETFQGLTYSPIRGIHPHLTRYLREFPKRFATYEDYGEVERYFTSCGMQVRGAPSTEMLEFMKLWETTEYGYRIAMWQEIERQMEKIRKEWGLVGSWDENLTAIKSWLFEKRKVYDGDRGLVPIMHGAVIGGHCVVQNWNLMRESGFMSPQLYRWLAESNQMRKEELEK